MKIRNGFVSNSSSSSYICEVCGETFEAYDQGISDFDLVMCKDQDHLFCRDHAINLKEDGLFTEYEADVHGDGENRIDSIHCPICQMKTITTDMILRYALKKLDTKILDIKKEMAGKFKNISELDDFIRTK